MNTHILVTNDDGVLAPGLFALVQEMRRLGRVSILAPDSLKLFRLRLGP